MSAMKILVVFGSASDKTVSEPLVTLLSADFDVEFAVISAHRDLDRLKSKIEGWTGDAIVAGAGLAAALPGVVAAMTALPVFGVPVAAQFGGLDSLCSIAQMPPGVPVITSGPDRTDAVVAFMKGYAAWRKADGTGVHFVVADPAAIVHPDMISEIGKATALARDKGLDVTFSATPVPAPAFNVFVVTGKDDVRPADFGLHVPFFVRQDAAKPENYLSVLDWTRCGGLWLGVNNMRNAVLAVARLKGVV